MAKLTYIYDRTCQYTGCGKELFGRSDKKYCNDACRNRANSKNRRKESWGEEKHIYEITRDLRRNRSIMKSTGAFLDQTKVVTRGWMLDRGYNFDYYTNILHTKKGDYFFCYEFGHMELENGKILVVMTDRYLEINIRAHDNPPNP
ncbi:hypothetical protein [Pedobacter cryotolerans]|uniref:DUF2116 family Zn-ribbon domain-containing protein n=1 Tax=Pedobacter cryotolerans TaxID=2571270 RepID=A0A4V5NWU7_9SPHI|nr:hypothetical protein [Pedobacter cryotolerans]TKB96156.1 hypothetical protein FA045_18615 [Pedobacter cryotolerans]